MVIWCGCALSVIIGGNQNVFTKNVKELEMEETKKNDKEIKDAEGEIKMAKRTWRWYHRKWKVWGDRCFVIANSLHQFPPHGRDPVTKKKYSTSKAFVQALRDAEKKHDQYKQITKRRYYQETGKRW